MGVNGTTTIILNNLYLYVDVRVVCRRVQICSLEHD